MRRLIDWFKTHWHKLSFKIFVICALAIIYLDIFHNKEFVDFIQFLLLSALKDLITNLVHNDTVVSALGIAIIGIVGAMFKKHKDD